MVWPFVQALWYSMTDWTGFTPDMNFVGLENYRKLLHDDIFMTALRNNILLAVVVPLVTVVLSFALATMVTVGGASHGAARGLRYSSFYRVISFFPYTVPAIIIGLIWAADVRPVERAAQRPAHRDRASTSSSPSPGSATPGPPCRPRCS